jgi:TP901-1 family phage major tail protein
MSAQKGKALLLKIGSGAPVVYATVAGLRLTRLNLNAEPVDVTNVDSANEWRELLAGAGVKSASLTAQGVFKDAASDETMRAAFFAQGAPNWQIVLPDFGTLTGPFQITQLEYTGEYKGEVTFNLTLASAGEVVFASI